MKRILIAAALMISALFLASCKKDESKNIIGSYTYKTSGTVRLRIVKPADPDSFVKVLDTVVTVGLNPEQGQMHIVSSGDNGAAKVTFNDIGGNVDVADARISGSTLTLEGTPSKEVRFSVDKIISVAGGIVSYSGSGRKYDRTFIADLKYHGDFVVAGFGISVVDSDVHCVAQSND